MFRAAAGVIVALWASAALAEPSLAVGPPGTWVKPVDIPGPSESEAAAPAQLLLQDVQTRFGVDSDELYGETAILFQTPQGLAAGTVALPWNPETDSLTVHKVHIIRSGKVIDVLAAGQTFTVLRRETNLDRAVLDGVLTAALQPEGLQVGDTLDLAFTIRRHDPALRGRSQYVTGDVFPLPIDRLHIRETWPTAKAVRWRELEGLPPAKVTKTADGVELEIDALHAVRPKAPKFSPARYANVSLLEASDFIDWADVSAAMAPLYSTAAALKPDSPLKAEAAKIAAASKDPKVQAAAALRLVQDQVRYVYLGVNDGGYVPAAADVTWARRFGDCKGKTALLLALLHELGIEAEPALVNHKGADGLDAWLPMTLPFDHVIVRARVAGKTYWLDGARTGDRDIDAVPIPNLDWALPVQDKDGALEKLSPLPPEQPLFDIRIRLDASAGLDVPAPAHLETIIRGDEGMEMNIGLDVLSAADREQQMRKYWSDQYSWIEIKSVAAAFDDATGDERLTMDGTAKMDWSAPSAQSGRRYETDRSALGWNADFARDPSPHQDAPFTVTFPAYAQTTETIVLPYGGAGFSSSEPDVSKVMAGQAFVRESLIDHGVFKLQASTRSVAREFPASEAKSAAAELKALAATTLYLNAPRWYDPTERDIAERTKAAPSDAGGFLDRADAFAFKGDYNSALADIEKADALKPHDADTLNARCFTRAEAKRELAAALADCNEALTLAPSSAATLDSRAFVYYQMGDLARAAADYNAALGIDHVLAPSLYMRGVIKRAQGDAKGGAADIAAAKALYPDVPLMYAKLGVAP